MVVAGLITGNLGNGRFRGEFSGEGEGGSVLLFVQLSMCCAVRCVSLVLLSGVFGFYDGVHPHPYK